MQEVSVRDFYGFVEEQLKGWLCDSDKTICRICLWLIPQGNLVVILWKFLPRILVRISREIDPIGYAYLNPLLLMLLSH